MNATTAPAPDTATSDNAAFEFVKSLAVELSGGKIELPAFPEVAVRVRRALAEDRTTLDQVVRIVGSEPALAARLLKLANSAALNRSGKQVTDLRTAINRMGYNMVRSAAISFAMAQIRQAAPLKVLSTHLRELWTASTQVAAFCFVLGRRTRINPDEALLVGLLHGIGKLYILTRAGKHPHLFNDEAALSAVVRDWHAGIGKAILESWGFADALVAAINDQEDIGREHIGPADLTDVLICGNMMAAFVDHPEDLELNMQDVAAFRRLNLDADSCREVMKDSKAEIEALRQALGT